MKDFLPYEGFLNVTGSRSSTKEVFNKGLLSNGQVWMDMIETRNRTVHTYSEKIIAEEYQRITQDYLPQLEAFHNKMNDFL